MLAQFIFTMAFCAAFALEKPMQRLDLFEGDMVLTEEQKRELQYGGIDPNIPLAARRTHLWPKVIPYVIDGHLSTFKEAMNGINGAIAEYHKHTCLRFVPRTTEKKGYMYFFSNGGGCWSHVGMCTVATCMSDYNRVSLSMGCWEKWKVMHEIAHALGFYHEQNRPDRDDYVTIHFENIITGGEHNFRKQTSDNVGSLNVPYDYRSVMHYGKKHFSKNGKITIETKDPAMQDIIGERSGFSKLDILQLNLLYQCPGVKPLPSSKPPRPQPGTQPPRPPTRPVMTSKPGCADKNASKCSSMKKFCRNSQGTFWGRYMKDNCQKTCGFC